MWSEASAMLYTLYAMLYTLYAMLYTLYASTSRGHFTEINYRACSQYLCRYVDHNTLITSKDGIAQSKDSLSMPEHQTRKMESFYSYYSIIDNMSKRLGIGTINVDIQIIYS